MPNNQDPYLVWAENTDYRGFSASPDTYSQVAVQADGANPSPTTAGDDEWPQLGLREICVVDACSQTKIYTGIVNPERLTALKAANLMLELNLPRYKTGSPAGGIAPAPVPAVALAKRVMAIIDYGCPFAHQQFWDSWKETTRVRYFWDQDSSRTIKPTQEKTELERHWFYNQIFVYGRETSSEELRHLFRRCMRSGVVDEEMAYELADYEEMLAVSSHGAHVMDLAAGRINPMSGAEDEASDCDIIFVQLPKASVKDTSGGSMTMYVLDALKYILDKTQDVEQLVINMSFGSTSGPHDGTSLLERGMDGLIAQARQKRSGSVELVLPAGNHLLADLHGAVSLPDKNKKGNFLWEINPDDPTENYLELWCDAGTELAVSLTTPSGQNIVLNATVSTNIDQIYNCALIRSTNSACGAGELVLVAIASTRLTDPVHAESGIWRIEVHVPNTSKPVVVNAWVERDDPMPWQSGQAQCRLLSSSVDRQIDDLDAADDVVKRSMTGNSLACGKLPIVVGGYVVDSMRKWLQEGITLSNYTAARQWTAGQSYLAPSDETDALTGIAAAGNKNNDIVQMNGTSVASPQVARQLLIAADQRRIRYPQHHAQIADLRGQRGIGLPYVY